MHDLVFVLNTSCVWHILFYHASWPQVFQVFQFSFFQAKKVNNCEGYVNFQDTEDQLRENILHHYLHCIVLQNLY